MSSSFLTCARAPGPEKRRAPRARHTKPRETNLRPAPSSSSHADSRPRVGGDHARGAPPCADRRCFQILPPESPLGERPGLHPERSLENHSRPRRDARNLHQQCEIHPLLPCGAERRAASDFGHGCHKNHRASHEAGADKKRPCRPHRDPGRRPRGTRQRGKRPARH